MSGPRGVGALNQLPAASSSPMLNVKLSAKKKTFSVKLLFSTLFNSFQLLFSILTIFSQREAERSNAIPKAVDFLDATNSTT